jgi:PilZ domain
MTVLMRPGAVRCDRHATHRVAARRPFRHRAHVPVDRRRVVTGPMRLRSAGTRVADLLYVAVGLQRRNQRGSLRVDVLLRVKGELIPADLAITIVNLSRTGFALISAVRFRAGDRLDFRLTGKKGPSVHVTAVAVHTQSLSGSPGRFVTGFAFRPGRGSGAVPDDAICQLIAAVAPAGFRF